MVPTWHARNRRLVAMISASRDGELVARLVERLGFDTVRGSSSRGGTAAAMQMIERLKNGQIGAMICDGPRGPRHQMKPGAPYMAIQASADVIPVAFAASSAWTFNSWDRFTVPKPFARVHLLYGEPIPHPGYDTDVQEFAQVLEDRLNDTLAQAESLAGGGAMPTVGGRQ